MFEDDADVVEEVADELQDGGMEAFMEMGEAVAAMLHQAGSDGEQRAGGAGGGARAALAAAPKAVPWVPPASVGSSDAAGGGKGTPTADQLYGTLPSLSMLLHDNPSIEAARRKAAGKQRREVLHLGEGGLPAAAAIGGLVAITGSLLSFAVARARHGKRERRLREGLDQKAAALSELRDELDGLRAAASRMLQLEEELTASNQHLLTMHAEVERARSASCRIESDMALFQDQLQNLTASESEVRGAMAAAEARAIAADKQRQAVEAQVREAEACCEAARLQLEAARLEVETLRGELGLRGSQLEGLTRELEFTRRQLANAEKRVERAQMEARSQRAGYASDYGGAWEE